MRRRAAAAAAALVLALAASPAAAQEPAIDLYTMGPGDDMFSLFGHAALCVEPEGRCYNYGVTDFENPGNLIWTFVRGRSKFWVSPTTRARLIARYVQLDRGVWRQRLPLTAEQVRAMAERMEHDIRPENKYYTYHHYHRNCTTEVRDRIDQATGGRLSEGARVPYGPTYREMSLDGFAGHLWLLFTTDLLLGRTAERYPTLYDAMLLPHVLQAEVHARFGVAPEQVYARKRPLPRGNHHRQRWMLATAGIAFGLLVAAALWSRRRVARRAALVVTGVALGLAALAVDALAILSVLAELRGNELLVFLWPTDLAIAWMNERALRLYVRIRLVALALVSLLWAVGVLDQPLAAPLVVVAAPMVALALLERPRAG